MSARCPILLVSGLNDLASPTSVVNVYVARLRAAGKQVETYMPENGPHGFYFGRPDIPEWKESTRRAVEFFQSAIAMTVKNTDRIELDIAFFHETLDICFVVPTMIIPAVG